MKQKNLSGQSNNDAADASLDQLLRFLQKYKLSQYFHVFVNEGFDRLLSLFDITENDLIALDVKRGHRRLLQRAIATARGVPLSTPIVINYQYEAPVLPSLPKPGTSSHQSQSTRKSAKKRRQYIPSKPVTAFDELLNEVRGEFKNVSSADIIPIAYERWNQLSGSEKEKYEREALHANSDYILDGIDLSHRYLSDSDTDYSNRHLESSRNINSSREYQPRPPSPE